MGEGLQLMSQEQAAKYLVVAWCKDWKMAMLLHTVCGKTFLADNPEPWKNMIAEAHAAFPWMPDGVGPYKASGLVRQFVGVHYPKLSAWLYTRSSDAERMRCAAQIQRLKCMAPKQGLLNKVDAADAKKQRRHDRAVQTEYDIVRAAKKTHGRSAWNVCK